MQPHPFKMEYKCSQKWERMPEKDGKKLCSQCNTVVHDLTEKSTAEILALIQKHNNHLCGYVFEDQLRSSEPHNPFSVKVAIAGLAALFMLGAARASAQNAPVVTEQRLDTTSRPVRLPYELLASREAGVLDEECVTDEFRPVRRPRHGRIPLFRVFGRSVYLNARFPFLHVRVPRAGMMRW